MLRFGKKKKAVPDGLFVKCDGCGAMVYRKNVQELLHVCPECNHHFRIGAWDRVELHTDEGSFEEMDADLLPCDPLKFVAKKAYVDDLKRDTEETGLSEAVICGTARIESRPVVFTAMDFRFRGASMGSVVGEKLTRAIELATERHLPLVMVAASGGARMQESALSLMQMAKTCAALQRFSKSGGAYVSVMTDPTTGGVTASWASMGDVIIAEPGALIGFAGPRVLKQTINQELPPDFQTSEFLLEHGFIDMIVERKDIKPTVAQVLSYLT
ncbi:MAG: acetyl-CoA carboxylase carboxyltransferase subunit beta [Candidatus Brocadiae bacterium]|nr:acetyl-CoA carboxylase carboxyltransferase subunit beta [Candidatus Brocadiia bacterium]